MRILIILYSSCFLFLNTLAEDSYQYQQTTLKYEDQKGDYLLQDLRKEFNGFSRLKKMLSGNLNELLIEDREKFPFYKNELVYAENNNSIDIQVESTQRPFTKEVLLENLVNPIKLYNFESGKRAFMGQCHEWSSQFKSDRETSIKIRMMGKLLTALSLGVTSQYLRTEQEDSLKNWMLSQEDRSITLGDIFYKSLDLNEGNIYLASLTIENVLSRYWRAENRESLKIIRKLSSITGILNDSGDFFGSWYHLWGMLTYGMCEGAVKSTLAGTVETLGSHFSYSFAPEPQQDFINEMAGPVGAKLASQVSSVIANGDVEIENLEIPKLSFKYLETSLIENELYIKSNYKSMHFCHLLINTYDGLGNHIERDIYIFNKISNNEFKRYKIEKLSGVQKIHITLDKCRVEG